MKMELFEESIVRSALEYACEDIQLAISEVKKPDFDSFPKTKHELLETITNLDRENVGVAAGISVMNLARGVHSILESNFDPSLHDLAEFIAGKLRYATKEDKRIVSAILKEVLP
jgi:hypothetical protein